MIVTTVHMANTNLEIAEACRVDSSAGWLGRVVEIDGDIVRRAITDTSKVSGAALEEWKLI